MSMPDDGKVTLELHRITSGPGWAYFLLSHSMFLFTFWFGFNGPDYFIFKVSSKNGRTLIGPV